MIFRRRRHRRWIALIALLGLLFQQLALAAYVCPIDQGELAAAASERSTVPPCHSPDSGDRARCHQHCHPLTPSFDQAPALTVPPALLPATTWLMSPAQPAEWNARYAASERIVRAAAPPLNIQHCTLQV